MENLFPIDPMRSHLGALLLKWANVSTRAGIKSANISSLDGKALRPGVCFRLCLAPLVFLSRRQEEGLHQGAAPARTHAQMHTHTRTHTRTDAAVALSVCDACKLDRFRPLSHILVYQIQILCSKCSHLNAYMLFFASMPRLSCCWVFFVGFFCFYSLHTGNVEERKSCLRAR